MIPNFKGADISFFGKTLGDIKLEVTEFILIYY